MQRGLKLIFLGGDDARIHGGLSLAVSAAAMGRPVSLFFQGVSVRALAGGDVPVDSALRASGVATIAELLAQAGELGIAVFACETGIHMTGIASADLPGGVETCGLIGFLAGSADAELVTV